MSLELITKQINNLHIQKNKYTYRIVTCSAIPPGKLAQCLAATSSIDPSLSTKTLLDPANLEIPNDKNFWIILKNTVTHEEEMIAAPLTRKQTKKWSESFVNTNLFADTNLYGKFSFPKLKIPDPESVLWEQTGFSIDNINFIATTVVQPTRSLSTKYDHIHFCLKTPWLPKTYSAFKQIQHSQSRKLVLYHEAIVYLLTSSDNFRVLNDPFKNDEFAVPPTPSQAVAKLTARDAALEAETRSKAADTLRAYTLASTLHGENITGDGDWHSYKLQGCMESTEIEKNPGSATVQSVLSLLYPYLLLLDSQTNVDYNLIQPCKYAYTFYIQKIAGCKIWGAVNMCASEEALYNSNDYSNSFVHPMQNDFQHSGEFAKYLPLLSVAQLQNFVALLEKLLENIKSEFEKVKYFKKDSPYNDINYPLQDDDEHEIYKMGPFKQKLQYLGLSLMRDQVSEVFQSRKIVENSKVIQTFIQQLLNAHNNAPFSHSLSTKTLAVVVDGVVDFIESIVEDFFLNVKSKKKTLKPSTVKSYLETDVTPKPFKVEQGLSFMRAIQGLPPNQWKTLLAKELSLTTDQMMQNMCQMPVLFQIFYHKDFFNKKEPKDFITDTLIPLYAQNQKVFEGSVYAASVLNTSAGYSSKQDETKLMYAMVFKVLDFSTPAHVWSWND
jgi:hypothetical protein